MKNPFPSEVKPVQCKCGHSACGVYGLSVGQFSQGSGFSKEEALFICELINNLRSNLLPDQTAPGMWWCKTCGFELMKNTLCTGDGNIYANTEVVGEPCPNDGDVMVPVTYKKLADDNYKAALRFMEELSTIRELFTPIIRFVAEHDYFNINEDERKLGHEALMTIARLFPLPPESSPNQNLSA